jgi:hypothetical protein
MQKGFHTLWSRVIALLTAGLAVTALVAIGGPASAVVCTSTPAGLIGRWPGDNSAVDVAHGRDGTLVGGTTYASSVVGQGFSFDGGDDHVTVPDSPDWSLAGDFTIDTWVRIAGTHGHSQAFVAQDEGSGLTNKWMFWYGDAGDLGFQFGTHGAAYYPVSASWSPALGTWYHVAVTRSGSDYTLYVDGGVIDTGTEATPIPDAAAPLTLGWGETDWFLDGGLDEPEIYQRALGGAEIAAIHTAGSAARCAIGTSSVTLQAAPTVAAPGSTVSLTGTLTLSTGTVTGTSIDLFRSVDGAAETSIGTVFAAADGSFSLDDSPPDGEITYRAAYAGATDMAATNGWASTSVQQQQSKVTIGVSDRSVTFGQATKVKVHLHGGDTNRDVRIYAQPFGGHKQLLKKGTVGNDGVLIASTKPARNTAYSASYAGDVAWKGDTSGSVSVTVAARWSGKPVGGYATSNGFRLYHYSSTCRSGTSTACPAATFTLAPNHAGQRVTFLGRYCKGGKCISDSGRYRLNKKSQVTVHIVYGSPEVIGFSLYLRFKFAGDSDHKGATSKVIKEKITS